MPKICVYTIALNEEKHVDRFMDSVGGADTVVILDTGSTDKTVEMLRKRGAIVHEQLVKPWRFDVARNINISHCPKDYVLFSVDLDEIIAEPDWRERFDAAWKPDHNRARYTYVWNTNPDGSDGRKFLYEKIHTHDYEWHLPCHEILRRTTPGKDSWAFIPITVRHYPDPAKSRGSYFDLLKMARYENPDNDRMSHYYGRELYYRRQWREAIDELCRHVTMNGWADEKAMSMSMIGESYAWLNQDTEAERWHLRACAEAPHLRTPFLELAKFYNSRNRFPMGYAFAKRSLQIGTPSGSYVENPSAWREGPWDLIGTAAYYLGLKPEALYSARKAYQLAPWDGRLKQNLDCGEAMCHEYTKKFSVPRIVKHEPWADNPKFGLVISTYGSLPYVHLALAVREKHYPDVPCLVVDDCSDEREGLHELAASYGAAFHTNSTRMNHTRGDTMAFATGLRWAHQNGLDVLVKMSRRFVPKTDWRPSLLEIIQKTMHATYAGILDATWGLRTECMALHVARWVDKADSMEGTVNNSAWLWVEKLLHDYALTILPWGCGDQDGAATWDFPGMGKWASSDTHLWHDTADKKEYWHLAQSLGLQYRVEDF